MRLKITWKSIQFLYKVNNIIKVHHLFFFFFYNIILWSKKFLSIRARSMNKKLFWFWFKWKEKYLRFHHSEKKSYLQLSEPSENYNLYKRKKISFYKMLFRKIPKLGVTYQNRLIQLKTCAQPMYNNTYLYTLYQSFEYYSDSTNILTDANEVNTRAPRNQLMMMIMYWY